MIKLWVYLKCTSVCLGPTNPSLFFIYLKSQNLSINTQADPIIGGKESSVSLKPRKKSLSRVGPSRRIFKGPAEFRFETLEKGSVGGGGGSRWQPFCHVALWMIPCRALLRFNQSVGPLNAARPLDQPTAQSKGFHFRSFIRAPSFHSTFPNNSESRQPSFGEGRVHWWDKVRKRAQPS